MCVTGVLLAFERQANEWADAHNRAPVEGHGGVRQPMSTLLKRLTEQNGLSGITIYSNPARPVAFAFGRERIIFLDPYDGRKLGEGSQTSRAFFGSVERFHRSLGGNLQSRGAGRALTGASTLVFLGLVISGFYLWFPRRWAWPQLRNSVLYRRGLTGKARNWNRHNVTAIWCAIPLFFIVLSGVIMAYPWANNLLYQLTGSKPPEPVRVQTHQGRQRGARQNSLANIDALFERAETEVPGWKSISLRLVPGNSREAAFTIDRGNGGQPQKRDQLTLDRATGQVVRWEPFAQLSLGRRLRAWARFTHTGEAGGLPGQLIAAIATAGGAFLVWTGIALALRRLKSSLAARQTKPALPPVVSV